MGTWCLQGERELWGEPQELLAHHATGELAPFCICKGPVGGLDRVASSSSSTLAVGLGLEMWFWGVGLRDHVGREKIKAHVGLL